MSTCLRSAEEDVQTKKVEKFGCKVCFTLLRATLGGRIVRYGRTDLYFRRTQSRIGNRAHSIKRHLAIVPNW